MVTNLLWTWFLLTPVCAHSPVWNKNGRWCYTKSVKYNSGSSVRERCREKTWKIFWGLIYGAGEEITPPPPPSPLDPLMNCHTAYFITTNGIISKQFSMLRSASLGAWTDKTGSIRYGGHIGWEQLLPPANGAAKVMFSVVSVRHSVHSEGSHVIISHDTLHHSVQGCTPWHGDLGDDRERCRGGGGVGVRRVATHPMPVTLVNKLMATLVSSARICERNVDGSGSNCRTKNKLPHLYNRLFFRLP